MIEKERYIDRDINIYIERNINKEECLERERGTNICLLKSWRERDEGS